MIEIFQISDLGELGLLKQRAGYVRASSPGPLVLNSQGEPPLSSCCGEINAPVSFLTSYFNTWRQPYLEALTVRGSAAPGALLSRSYFQGPGQLLPLSGSSRLALTPGQAERTAFFLRAPWRSSVLDNRDNYSSTGVYVCKGGSGFSYIFLFEFIQQRCSESLLCSGLRDRGEDVGPARRRLQSSWRRPPSAPCTSVSQT